MRAPLAAAFWVLFAACGQLLAQGTAETRPPRHPRHAGDQPHRIVVTAEDDGHGGRRFLVIVSPRKPGTRADVEEGYLTVRDGEKLVCACQVQAGKLAGGKGFTFTVAAAYLERSRFGFTVATASPAERKKLPSAAGWVGYEFVLKDYAQPPKAAPARQPGRPVSSRVAVKDTTITFDPKTCTGGRGLFFWGLGSCAVKVLGHQDGHCVFEYTQEIEMGTTVYLVWVPVDSGRVVIKIDSVTEGGSTFPWPVTSFSLEKAKVVRRGGGPGG